MTAPFALNTTDPLFDPAAPVSINGHIFIPAEQLPSRKPLTTRQKGQP